MPQPETANKSDALANARPAGHMLAATRVGSLVVRALLVMCGVGLIAGFFMRWFTFGHMVSASGFSMIVTEGEFVSMLSGSHRVLLFTVPVFGILLLIGGALGHRFALWVGLFSGLTVIGFGGFTLIRLFIETTGLGLWLVVGSSLLALALALIGIGRAQA